MPGDFSPWGTNEWDDHVQKLLKRRYMNGSYQQIPAETHGDCGLEGFSSDDATAYQCYSAQGWSAPKQLYEKQRGKITDDIGKFVANEVELKKLFGGVKIKRWKLVVPCWMNKDLIKHAKIKQAFVRGANLSHVAPDFEVLIVTGEDFIIEKQELASAGLHAFDVNPGTVADEVLTKWLASADNLELVDNLRRKSDLIGASRSKKHIERFQSRIVKNFISGSVVLDKLEKELPETHKRVIELKRQKEDALDTETLTHNAVPSDFFETTLHGFESQLASTPALSPRVAKILADEALADWLLRCPLDFEDTDA